MSTVRSLYELDTATNSLLNVSMSPTVVFNPRRKSELHQIRERYRDEYLRYQEEKQHKLA